MEKRKKYKQIMAGFVVFSMILSGFIVTTTISDEVQPLVLSELSLRIYGEENEVYPTHSYMNKDLTPEGYVNDFIYPEEYDPFDPGIIRKDSITFNAAWLSEMYGISAQGDAGEKVFLRTFYEPGYYHGVDKKMHDWITQYGTGQLYPLETFDAVVLETSYMLTKASSYGRDPTLGYPGSTEFWLPYASTDPVKPGMDTAGLVELVRTGNNGTNDFTDGCIAVKKQFELHANPGVGQTDTATFMDHKVIYKNFEAGDPNENDSVILNISYMGNMIGAAPLENIKANTHEISEVDFGPNAVHFFDRENAIYPNNRPGSRWFLWIESANSNSLTINLGRVLCAGETFYVDGMRYDMPAIYVSNMQNAQQEYGFKYITFQNPIPKCETIWYDYPNLQENVDDWTHVSSQYLANLPIGEDIWVLPPFDRSHIMVDDIGLMKESCSPNNVKVPLAGVLIEEPVGELLFYYTEEYFEPRFDSSLAERLETLDMEEYWQWYNVYTKPYNYTEFVLPDQEQNANTYNQNDAPSGYLNADGNEYLVTTSFIAQNSWMYDSSRDDTCKLYNDHEIWDRSNDIAFGFDDNDYYQDPRVVFEFDAMTSEDFYVNEQANGASVRIYGEDDAFYPTHSWAGTIDQWYPDETDAFNPGVIHKDSITFNPAWIDGELYGMQADLGEKVFLRAFYEPGYYHEEDEKMDNCYGHPNTLEPLEKFDAVVLETTYMMTTAMAYERDPTVVYPGPNVKIWLPYASNDPVQPGMDTAGPVYLVETIPNGMELTDGAIRVEKEFELHLNPGPGQSKMATFMDRDVEFVFYEPGDYHEPDKVTLKVKYKGNMIGADPLEEFKADTYELEETSSPQLYFFDRDNNMQLTDGPCYRSYIWIDKANSNSVTIRMGRILVAGETFYCDGVRYDIPAIYTTPMTRVEDTQAIASGFKYITLQTPIPKCETIWYDYPDLYKNVDDWTHVPSQYLANLPIGEDVWVLPPFNMPYTMIDDIGMMKHYNSLEDCWSIPAKGLILDGLKGPLSFYYIEETYEPRFDTSLTERLYTEAEDNEYWQWYNVHTKPYNYTEFWLPNHELTTDIYFPADIPSWYPATNADGNEYLITSSWIAQNCEGSNLEECKPYDVHDILNKYCNYEDAPRMAFEFDAETGTGLYINKPFEGPQTLDPTALGTAPAGCGTSGVTFSCMGSYDNDAEGTAPEIRYYRWDADNDGIWDTPGSNGWRSTTTYGYSWTYTGYLDDYDGNARLQVKDNDQETSQIIMVPVTYNLNCANVILDVDTANVPEFGCNPSIGTSTVSVQDVPMPGLNSLQVWIQYDETKFDVVDVYGGLKADMTGIFVWDDTTPNILKISWTRTDTTAHYTGTFDICDIDFEAKAGVTYPDPGCDLIITTNQLVDEASEEIGHTPMNGEINVIDCSNGCLVGDFHADTTPAVNVLDLRELIMLANNIAGYGTNGLNPDVSCNGIVDMVDVSMFAEWYLDGADQNDLGNMYPTCDPCGV